MKVIRSNQVSRLRLLTHVQCLVHLNGRTGHSNQARTKIIVLRMSKRGALCLVPREHGLIIVKKDQDPESTQLQELSND